MQKVILYIQPQLTQVSTTVQDFVRVDLMEEELITLTQVIQDVKDIEKLFTDYSRTFNLPASKTNNKIFKHWYNPAVDGFNNQIFCDARIELNHLHFKFGKIQLNEVVMKNNEPSMYKVTFFGNTSALKNALREDELSDLNWLNNFNHDYDLQNVRDGLGSGLNFTVDSVTYNDAVIYPLIGHSQSYIYDFAGNHQNPVNISTHSSFRGHRGICPEDLKPAIPIELIIKAIEQKYSFTFKTGEFLDSEVFDNMFMWLHRDKGKMDLDKSLTINNNAFTCSGTDCTALTDINYGDNNLLRGYFDLTTGIFNFKSDLTFDFEDTVFTVQITPTSSYLTIPYSLEIIRLDNMETFIKTERNVGTSSVSINMFTDPNFPNSATGNRLNRVDLWYFGGTDGSQFAARVVAEEDIYFNAQYTITRTYENTNPDGTTTTENLSGTFNNSTALGATEKFIVITEQIPKLKIKDFLNGLFRKYNLTAYLGFNNEIIVTTLDDYYKNGDTHDITEYVKTDEHTISENIPFSEVDFEYAEPSSILAQQFRNLNNKKYGELNYKANVSKENIYQIQLPFESMIYERLFDKSDGSSTTIQVGTFLDIDLNPNIGKPLIFYGLLQNDSPTQINLVDSTREDLSTGGHTYYDVNSYWIPSAYNELGTSLFIPRYNLNFGSEINTYTLTDYAGTNNSLFQNYYEKYITRVFSLRTRIFKFKACLPLKVLLNLSLDDLIIIGTEEYTINKMTTKLQSGETTFELLNQPSKYVSISYGQTTYQTTGTDPTPTVEPTGGTFSVI